MAPVAEQQEPDEALLVRGHRVGRRQNARAPVGVAREMPAEPGEIVDHRAVRGVDAEIARAGQAGSGGPLADLSQVLSARNGYGWRRSGFATESAQNAHRAWFRHPSKPDRMSS